MNLKLYRRFSANSLVLCLLLVCTLYSCRKEKSSDILSQAEMEDVLYDYHLADGMVRSQNLDSIEAQPYIEAVFEKHHIDQHTFDENMVYYLRHADILNDIYSNLNDRMKNEGRKLGIDESGMVIAGAEGDNTDVWNKERNILMRELPPYNLVSTTIKCDSTFHPGDQIMLSCHADFLYQDGSRNGMMVMAITFKNDSVATRTNSISGASTYNLTMTDDKKLGFKEVKVYLMDRQSSNKHDRISSTMRLMILRDIKLILIHQEIDNKEEDEDENKSDSVGSIPADRIQPAQ